MYLSFKVSPASIPNSCLPFASTRSCKALPRIGVPCMTLGEFSCSESSITWGAGASADAAMERRQRDLLFAFSAVP